MKWNGAQFEQMLRRATADGLNAAGTFYHAKCREAVSSPNSGVRMRYKDQSATAKDTREAVGRNKSSYTVYPNPSKPGEPPKLRTGFGQRNIFKKFNRQKMYVRVGIGGNAIYMFYLEVGTRNIARRPWLVATLKQHHQQIAQLATSYGK